MLEEKLDNETLRNIQTMVKDRMDKHDRVSLYLEDQHSKGTTLKAFLEDLFYETFKF